MGFLSKKPSTDEVKEVKKQYERMLCMACRHLTIEELKTIKVPGSGNVDGLEWYSNHIFNDHFAYKSKEEQMRAKLELNRINYDIQATEDGGYNLLTWRFNLLPHDDESSEVFQR